MSPVHLRNLGISRNQTEDREGLSRARRPAGGHLGHSGGWKDIEENHTHSSIHLTIQQNLQSRGLEGYGSSSSAPPITQISFPMEHGQQKVQPRIPLGRTWSKFPEDMSERDTLQRTYGNYQRLTRSIPSQLSSGFTPFRHQRLNGQESPFFTIPDRFQKKTRIQGKEQDIFQPKAERVAPNYPEAVGLGERSTEEPEIVVNTSGISNPTNKNITPTQTENDVVKPGSNLNGDKLWLQVSLFAIQMQEQLDYLKRLNKRLQRNAILQEATIKAIQEICAQLSKASEETNKRLNQVFEEKTHCKGDRDCLDQEINKLLNVYQNMKAQPQGDGFNDCNHQEDIKPDASLENK
ncbi:hypothetical protein O181_083021 [Austropuccinia psidii MF-1]|uniref:Uncharacterized protein n=1 Tax=Austropuccinia psidii MF-1 TaxID=1389203 RepID=A0A9Q3FTS5_9BASI|nr:hypothetical protein [Austropuccinia psidii MF-1]